MLLVKIRYFLPYLFLNILALSCTNIHENSKPTPNISLKEDWKFHQGDSIIWKEKDYNDAHWKNIQTSKSWESQGYGQYDGKAWYRKKVYISSAIKQSINPTYNNLLELHLGKIDDTDETYFNGKLVGSTGKLDDENDDTSYNKERKYKIPLEHIIWDDTNTIAVRINDIKGDGGLYQGKVQLHPVSWVDFISLEVFTNSTTGVKDSLSPITLSIAISNDSKETLTGNLICLITTDTETPIDTLSQNLTIKKGKTDTINVSFTPSDIGFYKSKFNVIIKQDTFQCSYHFGFAPDQIHDSTKSPDNLFEFWKTTINKLKTIDPQFKVIKTDEYDTDQVDVSLVEMRSLDNFLIRGWLSIPKMKQEKTPAILKVQGFSSYMMPEVFYEDFIVLALNIRGHGNSRDDIQPNFPDYLYHGIENRETYVYRGAYMDCIRAVDFLYSLEDVDTSKIAVEGGSQGGGLSLATAALDKRIKLCAPDIPFLSAFRQNIILSQDKGITGVFRKFVNQNPSYQMEDLLEVLDYFDVQYMAPWITCPVLMGTGLQDKVTYPYIQFAAYNKLGTKDKHYFIYPEYGHAIPISHTRYKLNWIKTRFGMN